MEVADRSPAAPAWKPHPRLLQEGKVRAGHHEHGVVEHARVRCVLRRHVPVANVGDLVDDQVVASGFACLGEVGVDVPQQAVTIVNQFPGEIRDRGRWDVIGE